MSKNENKNVLVALLLMAIEMVKPNSKTNTAGTNDGVKNVWRTELTKMFGDLKYSINRLGHVMVGNTNTLCLDSPNEVKTSSLWKAIGAIFAKLGAKIAGLTGKSGWGEAQIHAAAIKICLHFGLAEGKTANDFKWVVNRQGKKAMVPVADIVAKYLNTMEGVTVSHYSDLVTIADEISADDEVVFSASTDDEVELEEDEFLASDAVISGQTGKERLNALSAHYKDEFADTDIRFNYDSNPPPAYLMGIVYSAIMMMGNGLNLTWQNTKKAIKSLFSNEEALKAINKGVGTQYSTTYKGVTSTRTVDDLRNRSFKDIMSIIATPIMKSMHLKINGIVALKNFARENDFNPTQFLMHATRLVINTVENGGNPAKIGYGFIQEIERVGNIDMYDALIDHYDLPEDADDGGLFYAPMDNSNDDKQVNDWSEFET